MKYGIVLFILFFNLFLPSVSYAQCAESEAYIELDINNVRAGLLQAGSFWWDLSDNVYEVPKGSDKHSMFAGGLWVGALDEAGLLRVAAQTYRQSGNDFWPGPIVDEDISPETCSDFDRFWKVNGSGIIEHQTLFESYNPSPIPISQIDTSILHWPGRNNAHSTIELPTNHSLAPFYDQNNNGNYEPELGDHPILAEGLNSDDYADQMIWWVFNDIGNFHTLTDAPPLGVEVGVMAYAFATDDIMNDATFYRFTMTNRNTLGLEDLYLGFMIDPDLGNYNDDFIGCSPEHDLAYAYNGDPFDGVYGTDLPLMAQHFLDGPNAVGQSTQGLSHFIIADSFSGPADAPQTAYEYYLRLQGRWLDGTSIKCSSNGYYGDIDCDHMYPDPPNDPDGWSECALGYSPDDRRYAISSGSYHLAVGESLDFTLGLYWVLQEEEECPSIQPLIDAAQLAELYHEDLLSAVDEDHEALATTKHHQLYCYPNPTTSKVFFDSDSSISKVEVFGQNGQLLFIQRTDTSTSSLTLEYLPAGTYYLRFDDKVLRKVILMNEAK